MKTVMINASPKKKMSVSSYFLFLQRLFVGGKVIKEKLRNKGDHKRLLETVSEADSIVFCLPLYVDGVPSHVLMFLKELEQYCRENSLDLNVYVISNGGFIEGNQNRVLMQVFENFCNRSGINWCGGIGIGGGVMLNVMRIMFFIYFGIFLLNIISGSSLQDALIYLAKQWGIILFFNIGVLFYNIGMGTAISRGRRFGVKFTRAMMPSFLFIIVADIFFILISIFKGGIFRGWLKGSSKKSL
ncbi:MAG: hypothetical protein K2H01_05205 [Ruminococcus sp.]|nr:hypothetical protein [Ruminococcus sp.]